MILFGWAETDITPKVKIALDGEFFERATTEVESPLTVTALAIDADGDQSVLVSCDLVCVTSELVDVVRTKLTGIGLDPSKIIVGAIHSHNSYTYRRNSPVKHAGDVELSILTKFKPDDCVYIPQVTSGDCLSSNDAFDYLADAIAETVKHAWEARRPGGYACGFGRAAIGMNRRVCYSDGTAKMWGDVDTATFTELEAGNDSGIELLFTYDETGALSGVIANIACPAQVMEQRSVISSDYWGKVKQMLREKHGDGLFLLPLCSAAGDICPRDLIRWVEPETPIKDPNVIRNNPKLRRADPSMFDRGGILKIGRRITNEIEMALEEVTEITTEAVHSHTVENLKLPLRRVTDAERDDAERKLNEFFKGRRELDYNDSAALYVYAGTLERYATQQKDNTVSAEIHSVRLGDVVFLNNPFELFLDYGNRIRARSAAAQTFIIQLANGSLGYLPTAKAEMGGHYSAYVSSGYVGHEGGELLVSRSLDLINDQFDAD